MTDAPAPPIGLRSPAAVVAVAGLVVVGIAAFLAIAGPGHEAEITAGVVPNRIIQWFLLIPVGGLTLGVLRRHVSGGLLASHGEHDMAPAPGAGGTA